MKWESKNNAGQYEFNDLSGCRANNPYWNAPQNQAPLTKGRWYALDLKTKPITNAKIQGSLYQDILKIEEADGAPSSGTMPEPRANDEPPWLDEDPLFASKPELDQVPEDRPERPNNGIVVEGVVQGHLEKLAVNLCNAEAGGNPIEMWQLRTKRDLLFHELKQISIMPPHWCHEHEEPRRATKAGSYVHPFIDGDQQVFCTEKGLVDGTGKPLTGDPEGE